MIHKQDHTFFYYTSICISFHYYDVYSPVTINMAANMSSSLILRVLSNTLENCGKHIIEVKFKSGYFSTFDLKTHRSTHKLFHVATWY